MASSSRISRLVVLLRDQSCLRQLDLEWNIAWIYWLSFQRSSTSCYSSVFSLRWSKGCYCFSTFLVNRFSFLSLSIARWVTAVNFASNLLTSSLISSYRLSSIIKVVSLIHLACSLTLTINFWYFSQTRLPCVGCRLLDLLTLVCSCRFSFYFYEFIFLLSQSAFASLECEALRVSFLLRSIYRIFLTIISIFYGVNKPIQQHDKSSIFPFFNIITASMLVLLKFRSEWSCNPIKIIILIMLKKEGGSVQQRAAQTSSNFYLQSQQISQSELQQKLVHLQTILMLTQLNSAYFEMQLSLHKTLNRVEMKYFASKMKAFDAIRLCRANRYEFQQRKPAYLQSGMDVAAGNEVSRTKSKGVLIVLESMEAINCRVSSNVRAKLRGFVQLLSRKVNNKICLAFHLLLRGSNQSSTLKIHSDKSSKIETIDSQKSKVFKRSAEKRVSRKSFSLQKSITNEKGQGFVPVKYQANVKITPPMSSQGSSIQGDQGKSDISKLLKNVDIGVGRDRRNLLSSGRQRKLLKSTSSKKYNVSLATQGKQQKVRELQYLQRKYKKLIAEFNWFSERFLKVIEEQPI